MEDFACGEETWLIVSIASCVDPIEDISGPFVEAFAQSSQRYRTVTYSTIPF